MNNANAVIRSSSRSLLTRALLSGGFSALVNLSYTAARITYAYDDRGNCTEAAFFGADGKPCAVAQKVARFWYVYDDYGYRMEQAAYGTDGKLVAAFGGFARLTSAYDEWGYETESASYGEDGNRMDNLHGVARLARTYDELHNRASEAYFDAQKHLYETQGLARYDGLIEDIKARYAGTPIGASESIVTPLAGALGLRMLTPESLRDSSGEMATPERT